MSCTSTPWLGQLACPTDNLDTLLKTISSPLFQEFAKEAYSAPDGYSIRINPVTNKKEMFVAGTRDLSQWALNFYDGLLHMYGYGNIQILDIWRFRKQNELGQIATDNGVEVVYGHSRGGALVADMPLNQCTQRVGLDAAMMLAVNKNMVNLNEDRGQDRKSVV